MIKITRMKYDRPLFSDEQGLVLLNEYSGCLSVAGMFELKGKINLQSLRRSLDFVQASYPRLNCRIIGDLNNFQFQQEGTESIPLEFIQESDGRSWRDVLLQEVNTPIPRERYLLKCFLVSARNSDNCYYLITIVHHSISDGISFMRFNDLLLRYYAQIERGESLKPIELKNPEDNRTLSWHTRSLSAKLSSLMAFIKQKVTSEYYHVSHIIPDRKIPISERKGNFIYRRLPIQLTQKIVEQCQQRSMKVNGVFGAAMLLATLPEIDRPKVERLSLSCQSYIDLRSRVNPTIPDTYMALLISSVLSCHQVSDQTDFWELSREFNQKIRYLLDRGDFWKYPIILRKLIEFSLLSPENYTPSTYVTNVGKATLQKYYGELELDNICMFPNPAVYNNTIGLATYTFQDQFHLMFIFSSPSISEERVERFADRMVQLLRNAVA